MTRRVTERPQAVLLSSVVLCLLLVSALCANVTDEQQDGADRNQTSTEPGGASPFNVTQLKENLQSNQTSAVIAEYDESFQDQENQFSGGRCAQSWLVELSHSYCGSDFHKEMQRITNDSWCVLEHVIRPYNNLTVCLEMLSHYLGCFFPNPQIQDFFLYIHSVYFQDCGEEPLLLEDAPHGLVITLTLIPVSLIPVLVYMVVWKSKVQT